MKIFSRLLFFPLAAALPLAAQDPEDKLTHEQTQFFETKIRPALVKHCYQCHAEEGDKVKGGLLLDTRASSRSGGDSGPAVVPFDLNESLLYVAMTYEDSSLEMPPKYKLDDETIADFAKWIEMGAPDPRDRRPGAGEPQQYTNTIDIEAGRAHWAYQAPTKPSVPETKSDWNRGEIDAFVSAKRSEHGFDDPADADASTLLRRLRFDLTGLPPTSNEVTDFATAYSADPEKAIADTVNRLLESDQFGERFGRLWMDVARYAESTGKEVNATYPHAWRYRDWVIDAFNSDTPFDEFVTAQIAGDLLEAETPEEEGYNTIATGFLAIGTKGLNDQNARQFRFDLVDEQIDTVTQAFLGTTAACARCHDHKFDPIPMSDYYAMAGIFLSSDTLFGTVEALQNRKSTDLLELPSVFAGGTGGKSLGELLDLEMQRDVAAERVAELRSEAQAARRSGDADAAQRFGLQARLVEGRLSQIENEISLYDDDGAAVPLAMGVRDREEPFDSQILIRGEEDNPTDERVPRGFLQVVQTHDEEPIPSDASGRLELAQWIVSPENPLTARVFVNRVWSWMMGEGIVRSVDNFGTTGDAPTHPELLDYLAVRLHELDWSVKELVREIATSRTYRMASDYDSLTFEKDPENKWLWRANKRRLDAESLRDAMLAASGELDLERPEASVVAEAGDGFVGRTIAEAQIDAKTDYRSVYLPIVRGLVPESLALFDFADPSLLSGKREITTVPSQALYLMNSDFVVKTSEAMARELTVDLGLRGAPLANEAFVRCYGRPPTEEEGLRTREYVDRFVKAALESGKSTDEARLLALTTFCQSLIASAEFRYLN